MVQINNEYIEKHSKTHKKGDKSAKKQNFKNKKNAFLSNHQTKVCAKFQLHISIGVDASSFTNIHIHKQSKDWGHLFLVSKASALFWSKWRFQKQYMSSRA